MRPIPDRDWPEGKKHPHGKLPVWSKQSEVELRRTAIARLQKSLRGRKPGCDRKTLIKILRTQLSVWSLRTHAQRYAGITLSASMVMDAIYYLKKKGGA